MKEKKKSIISKITLNTPTYTNEIVDNLSFVNFFYGHNGTGKSTIAEEINNHENLVINTAYNINDYNVYTYNSDFIKRNFTIKDKVKAIYTLGDENIENQKRLEEIKKCIKDNKKKIEQYSSSIQSFQGSIANSKKNFYDMVWKETSTERDFFSTYIAGFKKDKQKFSEKVIESYKRKSSCPYDLEKLKEIVKTAFESDETKYPLFALPEIKIFIEDALLNTPLTTSESTEFARFIKVLNNASWLKEGHDKYHPADSLCPYCKQPLPSDFEEQYKSCFDEDYQKSLNALKTFKEKYKLTLDSAIYKLKDNLNNAPSSVELSEYNSLIQSLENTYSRNISLIDSKIERPELCVSLENLDLIIQHIKTAIDSINTKIKEQNSIVDNKKKIKVQCENDIYKYFANKLVHIIENFLANIKELEDKISEEDKSKTTLENSNKALSIESSKLVSSAISAEPVVKAINETIKNSGFQGFHLEWDESDVGSYQVVYNSKDKNGKYVPATRLSEGETNFIAFLYFYYMVVRTDETGSSKESIVVIDDPVSSMDSQTLFIVSSLVKNLIDRCINASSIDEGKAIRDNNVAQIFILTHNVYFHANVTAEYETNYPSVNYYQITKHSNKSKVKLKVNEKDGEWYNENPIKNSYAALWRELEEVETSISACNIIQRILGYYFINLCGYTNKKLEENLLINNSTLFLKDNEGNDTEERFNLVRSFLEYLGHSQNTVGNEAYYVDECDVETCRETLKIIFDAMNQSQHYDMMTKKN